MPVKGKWTPCDLSNIEVLPFFQNNHQFTDEAAMLSLELSAAAYEMETDDWLQAGWTDFSFQVDNKLFTGSSVNPSSSFSLHRTWSRLVNSLARHRVNRDSPLSQLRGTLQQYQNGNTCKAITMLFPQDDHTYIVAIGFMGTGKRIYDWIPNFRLQRENGLHLGFSQLSKAFEDACGSILFSNTARHLKEEKLTLLDILEECTHPDSRFKIFMSGHSQGSAVMQIFTDHIMRKGVLSENIFGCGFASPSVAEGPLSFSGLSYPLVHLLNSDDMVPRVGVSRHLGKCLMLNMKDDIRRKCYGDRFNSDCFRALLIYAHSTADTRSAFLFMLGLLYALLKIDDQQAVNVLAGTIGISLPATWSSAIGNRVDFLAYHLYKRTKKAYFRITGDKSLPLMPLYDHAGRITKIIQKYGARTFARTLSTALSLPHHLRGNTYQDVSVYQELVLHHFDQLRCTEDFTPNCLAIPNRVYLIPKKSPVSRFRPLSLLRCNRKKKQTF